MLLAGNADGIVRLTGLGGTTEADAAKLLDADEVYRIRQFDGLEGVFATAESGVYYSPDGDDWQVVPIPAAKGYAIAASPAGDTLYVGTQPAGLLVTECGSGIPTDEEVWDDVDGFRRLRERHDWGIPRHDGLAQVRSVQTHPETPERLVAGIEVGGIYVSDDRGNTWTNRCITGFDAPHTDDIHHIAMENSETIVASTGSGLYRSSDVGRTWERLDTGHRQRYFREAFARDGSVFAGGAPASSTSWETDTDHALFECHDGHEGGGLERVTSPTPDEVVVGWCRTGNGVLAATNRGAVLRRDSSGWTMIGRVPTPEGGQNRYLPLSWYEG